MRPEESYKVAIIGCGRMAGTIDDERPPDWIFKPSTHAGAYRAVESTTIVAAANRGREALTAFCERWEVPASYTDYREMIESERPDIVSVCTPQESHPEIVIFAAEHGVRAILCEKPMAPSVVESDRMVKAIQANGVCFNLGVNRRFRLDCGIARGLIAAGELGEVKSFHIAARGTLKNIHSHYVDLMCYLLQDATPLSLTAKLHEGPVPVYEEAAKAWTGDPGLHWLTVGFEGGKTGYIHDPQGVAPREWRVTGTEGFLLFNEDGRPPLWRGAEGEKQFPRYAERHSPTVRMVEDLVACMNSGEPCLANELLSARVNELCTAAALSHRSGCRPVELPLTDRSLFIPAQAHSRITPKASPGRS